MPLDKKKAVNDKKKAVNDKKKAVNEANALIEMYKAGFYDGYKIKKTLRSKESFLILNKLYKKAFIKRFEKKINKELEKKNAPISIRKRKV